MNPNLKRALAALPLLTGTAVCLAAQPLVLDAASMDRVTAGSRPLFERIASVLATLPPGAGDIDSLQFERFSAKQQALLTRALGGEQITFQQTRPGELTATQQLASGETLVVVKQLAAAADAAAASSRSSGQVTTYLVNPGESLNVRQTSVNGINYLYIRSAGNSTITATQRSGF